MVLYWETTPEMLNQISLTNRGWKTEEAGRGSGTYTIYASCNQKIADDSVVQEIALLRIDLGLMAKQFTTVSFEKVNAVGVQGLASKTYELELEEEVNYLYY